MNGALASCPVGKENPLKYQECLAVAVILVCCHSSIQYNVYTMFDLAPNGIKNSTTCRVLTPQPARRLQRTNGRLPALLYLNHKTGRRIIRISIWLITSLYERLFSKIVSSKNLRRCLPAVEARLVRLLIRQLGT